MSNRKKSIKNVIYSALGQVITIGCGLILPRLFVVGYGSEVNGLLNSLSQFLVYLGLFEAGVGTATMQALYNPVAKEDWGSINKILAATNEYYKKTGKWYLIVLTIASIVYPIIVESSIGFWTIAGAVFFSGIGNVILFYVQGKYRILLQVEGKGYIYTNLTTFVSVLVSLAKVGLIYIGADILSILIVSAALQCIHTVYILWYIKKKYKKLCLEVEPDYQAIEQKNFALVHQISSLVFQNTDVLLLTVFVDLKIVSVYSLFKMVTSHIDSVLAIIINSISFALGQLFQIDKKAFVKKIDWFEACYSTICFAVYSVVLYLYLPFMKIYTKGVSDINYIDKWLAVLFVVISLLTHCRVFMLQTINYAGHYRETMKRSVAETLINLVSSFIGVWLWGIYGVLLGTVAALLYRTNDIIVYANVKLLKRSPKKTYLQYFSAIVLFVVVGVILNIVLRPSQEIDSIVIFCVEGIKGLLISMLVYSIIPIVILCKEKYADLKH